MRTNVVDIVCGIVVVLGAIDWGVVGIAGVSIVAAATEPIFQPAAGEVVTRAIYVLVGLAGLYFVYPLYKLAGDYRLQGTVRD